jgi:hypothetical protein
MIGPNSSSIALIAASWPAHAALDIVRGALDHHDRVVDDDADRQHDREQRREVNGEAERPHGGESANDGDRHGRRRHQHGAPVLQEHQDHDQHQHRRLDQRAIDLVDRGVDEFRGVEGDLILDARREALSTAPSILAETSCLTASAFAPGVWKMPMRGRGLSILREDLAVGLRTQFDTSDILDADELAAGSGAGLDDDVLVLLDLVEPAGDVDGVLEVLPLRHRRHADLAGGDLLALLIAMR